MERALRGSHGRRWEYVSSLPEKKAACQRFASRMRRSRRMRKRRRRRRSVHLAVLMQQPTEDARLGAETLRTKFPSPVGRVRVSTPSCFQLFQVCLKNIPFLQNTHKQIQHFAGEEETADPCPPPDQLQIISDLRRW